MVENPIRRDGCFYIPDFIEIQKSSFSHFLEVGIIHEFRKMGPIFARAGEVEIRFNATHFFLAPPDLTIREAILKGKTYESKLYLPAQMVSKGGRREEWEWVLVGSIPLMTRRGHFIINGSPRVIVNQMVRSPGIYFRCKVIRGVRRRQLKYVDVIPRMGSWLRLQQKEGQAVFAHMKQLPPIPYDIFYTSMVAVELREDTPPDPIKRAAATFPFFGGTYRRKVALFMLNRLLSSETSTINLKKVKKHLAELEEWPTRPYRKRNVPIILSDTRRKNLSKWIRKREFHVRMSPSVDVMMAVETWLSRNRVEGGEGWKEGWKGKPHVFLNLKQIGGSKGVPKSTIPMDRRWLDFYPWTGGAASYFEPPSGESLKPWGKNSLGVKTSWMSVLNMVDMATARRLLKQETSIDWGKERGGRRKVYRKKAESRRRKLAKRWLRIVGKIWFLLFTSSGSGEDRPLISSSPDLCWDLKRVGFLTQLAFFFYLRGFLVDQRGHWESQKKAAQFLVKRFKNPATYDLGRLGRGRIAKKLENGDVRSLFWRRSTQLMARDLELVRKYMNRVTKKTVLLDDIDHLKNRRVKTCGELLQNQFQVGLSRLKMVARVKVRRGEGSMILKRVIDAKALDGAWREFFGSNPLSQYMDQTNPLAEITHKRRVSCLGPGGVSRDTAGMSMRGIHPSHYGRICPIETPEGKNAGLVNSIGSYTWINPEGVLETPYYRVKEGQVQRREGFHFFSAQQEEEKKAIIAPADIAPPDHHILPKFSLPVRRGENLLDNFNQAGRDQIQYISISRIQMISVATSLIPFLEHNDGNRALMGSNMQRQAVPPLTVEQPIVATGLEGRAVGESDHVVEARSAGRISYVSGKKIVVQRREGGEAAARWVPRRSTQTAPPWAPSCSRWSFTHTASFLETASSASASAKPMPMPRGLGYPVSTQVDPVAWQRDRVAYSVLRADADADVLHGSHLRRVMGWVSRRDSEVSPQVSPFVDDVYPVHTFEQSNQKTSLCQRPWVREGDWVQPGDLLADCAASQGGQLSLGKNVVIAYLPWEGYNFEDAVVVSDRLIFDDLYTSLHIERYEDRIEETDLEDVCFTWRNDANPFIWREYSGLDDDGVIRVGRWVETGDTLASKIIRIPPFPLSGYQRLAFEILKRRPPTTRDISLRVPKWVEGRVIDVLKEFIMGIPFRRPPVFAPRYGITEAEELVPPKKRLEKRLVAVWLYLVERKKIKVGDKVAGRHGNKGIISTILPREDMPYLPDGTIVDMVLNPLGVPSRMNVGQVFEALLGLAGGYLKQRFTITPFDEMYGSEASRSLVYLKLYQARLRLGQDWLFCPEFPGKTRMFDGRSGEAFHQPVTVGRAYMLKLIHMVDEKIHGRSRGPYNLITQQPVRGRARGGGQRLGEMEVWAVEGHGAAYTLQEILTTKADHVENRRKVWKWIAEGSRRPSLELERSGGFTLVFRELQSLCLDLGVYGNIRKNRRREPRQYSWTELERLPGPFPAEPPSEGIHHMDTPVSKEDI
jgi:DNA-directed RNA polymerase beta subunit